MIRWDPYGVRPPVGDWEYAVDDRPIRRAPQGSPRLLAENAPFVRLAPNVWHCLWRNEYVTVFEGRSEPPTLIIRGTLYLRPRDSGADLLDFEALVIDPAGEPETILLVPHAFLPGVQRKITRVLDWYALERKRREAGLPPVLTSHEYWYSDSKTAIC